MCDCSYVSRLLALLNQERCQVAVVVAPGECFLELPCDDDSFYLLCIILEAPTLVRQSRQVCECSRFGCPAGPTGTMYMKLAGYVKLLKAMAVTMKA
ncbi:hypothetical protein Tco_0879052, partial [Tanacetum coccineum]